MWIGAMNHPAADVLEEIRRMAEMGLDFVDLTLEPPAAASWQVDARAIRKALNDHGLKVIGHTAYYLPLASPFERLRRAALDELARCLDMFAAIGCRWMNIHPDRHAPFHRRREIVARNVESLAELLALGRQRGVGLMIENLPRDFNSVEQLAPLLRELPDLGLHLDIGHCNLLVEENTASEIIAAFGARIQHVHLHDNRGGDADLHLPLGAGTIRVEAHLGALKQSGYDDTITLEVFSADKHYLAHSRDVLRRIWDELPSPSAPPSSP